MASRSSLLPVFVCLLLLCLAFTGVHAQDEEETPEYLFDTSLSHEYSLVYKTDDSLQYLFLRHGAKLTQISWEYKENKQSLLGYIAYDFDKYFVLLHTMHVVGNQDPMMFDLIEKKTAKVVFKGDYIDARDSLILFHAQDTMRLYNIYTKRIEQFDLPPLDDVQSDRLINMIRIKSITPGALTITYYKNPDENKPVIKKYVRKQPKPQ